MKTCFHCTRLYYFPAGKPGPASEFGGEKRLQAPPLGHQSESELPLLVCQMPAKRVHIVGFNHSTTLYERARERERWGQCAQNCLCYCPLIFGTSIVKLWKCYKYKSIFCKRQTFELRIYTQFARTKKRLLHKPLFNNIIYTLD